MRWRKAAIWQLPRRARSYVLSVDALAVACLALLVARASWRADQAGVALAFLASGVVSIELFRRIAAPTRRSDRPYHNLLSAFFIPVILLLPLVYAALVPLGVFAIVQTRWSRIDPVKRVFNTAIMVIVATVSGLVWQTCAEPLTWNHLQVLRTTGGVISLAVTLVVYLGLNKLLVYGVLRAVSPATPWRALVGDAEGWILAVVDVCAGVVLALVWLDSHVLVVLGLVPIVVLQRAVVHTHLVEATRHETKTGLANPAWWREEAGRAVRRARRDGAAVAVVIVDLDKFKAVNDQYGHLRGDSVLAAIADTLRLSTRPADLVGRFGGDEFTILVDDAGEARVIAERVRARLAAMAFPVSGGPALRVTASIGIAVLGQSGFDVDELLGAADRAMYQAKAAGGNCLRFSAPVPAPEPEPSASPVLQVPAMEMTRSAADDGRPT